MSKEKVFIIEHCENCQMHQWNTRHDANLYKQHAIGGKCHYLSAPKTSKFIFNCGLVAGAIKECVPGATVIFNLVPKVWAMSDIYCQLIPNEDESIPNYEIVPRIGAFEVSVNGIVSNFILISKFRINKFQKYEPKTNLLV